MISTVRAALRFTGRSGSRLPMMRRFSLTAIAVAALAATACAPEATTSDGGRGGGGSGGSGGGGGGGAAVTYTKDVQPIFMAKCGPCHTTYGLGAHNIATTYEDAFKPVQSLDAPAGCFMDVDKTMPKKIGECSVPAIMEGWMPMSMGCFNTPRPAACVSLAEQDIITAWVAAGMPK